jgi:chromate reductase, NAD(P)H dehydrogenase (quinone)
MPAAVARLKDLVADSDGLVIATPEYNGGIPGVAKNAIDWMSRPASDMARVFGGRPVALMGASPGAFGTVSSQNAWVIVLRRLSTELWGGDQLTVPRAHTLIDASGEFSDEKTLARIRTFMAGFAAHVGRVQKGRSLVPGRIDSEASGIEIGPSILLE